MKGHRTAIVPMKWLAQPRVIRTIGSDHPDGP
ncbi:hypothetical protein C7821_107461 [Streptomyces sp. VMFN-G11Ma]|jgi:hypothetical protein|nr:hypothetical protein C7821_107461 [Streptomyces sp. VMFN-G11Ma]